MWIDPDLPFTVAALATAEAWATRPSRQISMNEACILVCCENSCVAMKVVDAGGEKKGSDMTALQLVVHRSGY